MQNGENKYKRVLVVNDDNTKEDFINKYKGIDKWEEDIIYCQSINDALRYLEDGQRFCCDKVLLDIKIAWDVEEKYAAKVVRLVDVDSLEKEYGGFILFMYLMAKGFPINRIAFLSAYLSEEDSERKEKEQILSFLKKQKFRRKETDNELRKLIGQVSSQKAEMLRILENPAYKPRELKPYEEITKLLEKDLEQLINPGSQNANSGEMTIAREFFEKIAKTGLIVKNKINKANGDKLLSWIRNETEQELESYYAFRAAALNICDVLIEFYSELEHKRNEKINEISNVHIPQEGWKKALVLEKLKKDESGKMKKKGIYSHARNNQQASDILQKYPPLYFAELLSTVKNMLSLNASIESMQEISNNVINSLISYWEGFTESEQNKKNLNIFSATMALKFARNWKMHNLIQNVDVSFMYFIFSLSVFLLGYDHDKNKEMLSWLSALELPALSNKERHEIHAEEKFVEINEKLHKEKYVLSLSKLYGEYGRDPETKLNITVRDIYELFYLCLHFPYIEDNEVKFVENDCEKKDDFLKKLEQMAYL